jgi:hypothetical protein
MKYTIDALQKLKENSDFILTKIIDGKSKSYLKLLIDLRINLKECINIEYSIESR